MHSSLSYLSSSLMLSVIAGSCYAAPEGRTVKVCCKMCSESVYVGVLMQGSSVDSYHIFTSTSVQGFSQACLVYCSSECAGVDPSVVTRTCGWTYTADPVNCVHEPHGQVRATPAFRSRSTTRGHYWHKAG
jgi:hypothetical protein